MSLTSLVMKIKFGPHSYQWALAKLTNSLLFLFETKAVEDHSFLFYTNIKMDRNKNKMDLKQKTSILFKNI